MEMAISKWIGNEIKTLISHYVLSLILLTYYDYLPFNFSPKQHNETFYGEQCDFSPFTALVGR